MIYILETECKFLSHLSFPFQQQRVRKHQKTHVLGQQIEMKETNSIPKKLQTYLSSDKRVDRWFLLRDFCWDLETNLRSLNPYSRWIFLSSIFKLSTLVSTIQLELSLSPLSSHEKLTETETPEKLTRFTFSVSAKHFSWNYHVSTSILIISILQAQENGRCPSRNLKTSRLLTRYP